MLPPRWSHLTPLEFLKVSQCKNYYTNFDDFQKSIMSIIILIVVQFLGPLGGLQTRLKMCETSRECLPTFT